MIVIIPSGVAAVLEHARITCLQRYGRHPLRFDLHPIHLRDLIEEMGIEAMFAAKSSGRLLSRDPDHQQWSRDRRALPGP